MDGGDSTKGDQGGQSIGHIQDLFSRSMAMFHQKMDEEEKIKK